MSGLRTVIAHTDGACSGNPGPGAWAYVLEWPDGRVEEGCGTDPRTTNNRMELIAVRQALRAVRAAAGDDPGWRIVVRTDSQGVINWMKRTWKRNKNLDLFPDIDALVDGRVSFRWVKGHSGDVWNDRVDALAVSACQELQKR